MAADRKVRESAPSAKRSILWPARDAESPVTG